MKKMKKFEILPFRDDIHKLGITGTYVFEHLMRKAFQG